MTRIVVGFFEYFATAALAADTPLPAVAPLLFVDVLLNPLSWNTPPGARTR